MKTRTSPIIVICATVVLTVAIVAIAALLATGADAERVGILTGFLTLVVVQGLALVRGESIKGTVDDLANGKMDAKIRAGVADVLGEHLIDPKARVQIAADRERRGEHA